MTDRKFFIRIPALMVVIAIFLLIFFLPFTVSGNTETVPVSYFFEQNIPERKRHNTDNILTLISLNIGHGRGSNLHQLTQDKKDIKRNIDTINEVIIREQVDIAALQEVDGPGIWNGGLDLIEYLAENSGMPHGIWTKSVETTAISYGTALLSGLPYLRAESYTFKAKPFTLPKGFTAGLFKISEHNDSYICVVSLHLAPLLPQMRRVQVRAVLEILKDIDYPLVVCGDFNSGWRENSAVKQIADELNLKAWRTEQEGFGTHHPGNRRIDWILISDELEFIEYKVLDEKLSDHSAVKAVIRYNIN